MGIIFLVISSIFGILVILSSFLIYFGSPYLSSIKVFSKGKSNPYFLLAGCLFGFTMLLGFFGYYNFIHGGTLRLIRLILVLTSGLIVIYGRAKILELDAKTITTKSFLVFIAVLFVSMLLIKSLISIDQAGGDTWTYHLPFAARIWGIITKKHYLFEHDIELNYVGFPKLANFFQGFFWSIAGIQNPQAANLVSFLSLTIFLFFLKSYLKIPLYLSAIALLAVPLIHIATTAAYVDLFGNVGVAILILMTYLLYLKKDFLTWKNVIVYTLAGAAAANTKYLLVPPVFLIYGLTLIRIIYDYIPGLKRSLHLTTKKIIIFLTVTLFSSCIIFATEIYNTIVYGNPLYPLKIQIAGIVLNHTVVPSANYMSPKIQAMMPLQRWIYSLLEIDAFSDQRPLKWTIAMDFVPLDSDNFGMGGYFALYVVFNVSLFLWLCCRRSPETKIALPLFVLMSIVTIMLPFSYQLRYYMYWIMVLISLNLFLVLTINSSERAIPVNYRFVNAQNVGLVATVFLIAFVAATRWEYTYPRHRSLAERIDGEVRPIILREIKEGEEVCLVGMSPHTFLYNSQFYAVRNYSVKAEFMVSPEFVKEKCGSRHIIAPYEVKPKLKLKS